jgi:thiamine biosynthesis lipoprotein
VQRAIKISELTSGAFDISYALWIKYGSLMVVLRCQHQKKLKICFKSRLSNIILDSKNNTIFLKNEGMKLKAVSDRLYCRQDQSDAGGKASWLES